MKNIELGKLNGYPELQVYSPIVFIDHISQKKAATLSNDRFNFLKETRSLSSSQFFRWKYRILF